MATQCWAEGVWTGTWSHELKRSLDEADSSGTNVETGEWTRRSSDV